MAIDLHSGQKLLFIGDSITDCGRRDDAQGLGYGYVRLIHDYLAAKNPAMILSVINTGISGNKVTDLAARWKQDVIDHQPDLVSINIGINDVWHGLDPNCDGGVPIEQFVEIYHVILRQLQGAVAGVKIVLCQPSVIEPPAQVAGNAALQPYVRAIGELKREFAVAAMVPLHGVFVSAKKLRPDISWTPDGVHPGSAGHMVIARTWLVQTGLL
jgi:acyl-CoA thioesterase I